MTKRAQTALGIMVMLVLAVGCGPRASGAKCGGGAACGADTLCLGEAPPATRPAASLGAPVTRAAPSSPTPSPPSELELRLNAITQQDGRPVAVLNDRVVREGDVFDGIHVIRIGEAEVEVEVNGKRRVVRF